MNYFSFIRQFPRFLFFGLLVKFFSSPGQTFFLSMFSSSFRDSLGLGEEFYNVAYSVATLASAVTISIVGPNLDKITSLRGTQFIAWGLIISSILMSFTHWVFMWCICLFLVRFAGQGMMGLTAQTAMIRWFHSNRGKALGLTSIGFSIGEIIFPLFIPLCINLIGWRMSWWVVAGLVFVFVILWIPSLAQKRDEFVDVDQEKSKGSGFSSGPAFTRGMILKDVRFYLFTPSMMVLPMVATGLIWNQSGIAEWRGWDQDWMIRSFIGFGVGRLLFSLIAGPLVDKYSAIRIFGIFLIPVSIAVTAPLISGGLWVPWLLYILLGLGQGLAGVTGSALWPEIYGTKHIASIKSFTNTFAVFSTALGPGVISFILKLGHDFDTVLLTFLVISISFWILGLCGIAYHLKKKAA